jgi:phosphoribosylaminoimidazole carboxylase PurE protein
MNGGRIATVVGTEATRHGALRRAMLWCNEVEGAFYRRDIARIAEAAWADPRRHLIGSERSPGHAGILKRLQDGRRRRVARRRRIAIQATGVRAARSGVRVLIAGAGMAAHLAGALASETILPVISAARIRIVARMDALLATVQMPTGLPVATVAIGGAANAILAAQILALEDADLRARLLAMRQWKATMQPARPFAARCRDHRVALRAGQ